MIVLACNCRGLEKPRAVNALKCIVEEKDPDMVFLSKTKQKYGEIERIRRQLRYGNKIYVDRMGEGRCISRGLPIF